MVTEYPGRLFQRWNHAALDPAYDCGRIEPGCLRQSCINGRVGLVYVTGHQVRPGTSPHRAGQHLDGRQQLALDNAAAQRDQVMQRRRKGLLINIAPADFRVRDTGGGFRRATVDRDAGSTQDLAMGYAVFSYNFV